MTMFNKLFSESKFDSISSKDVENGTISGIVSPYLGSPADEIGITLDNLESQANFISNKIAKLYAKYSLNLKLDSANNLSGFSMFSDRLMRAFELNNIFADDPVIRKKLADLLTYFYISLSKQNTTYLIYSDLNQAKRVAHAVFNKAEKQGLNFLDSSISDLIKIVLLSVFYQLPKDKKAADKEAQVPEQAPLPPPQ